MGKYYDYVYAPGKIPPLYMEVFFVCMKYSFVYAYDWFSNFIGSSVQQKKILYIRCYSTKGFVTWGVIQQKFFIRRVLVTKRFVLNSKIFY